MASILSGIARGLRSGSFGGFAQNALGFGQEPKDEPAASPFNPDTLHYPGDAAGIGNQSPGRMDPYTPPQQHQVPVAGAQPQTPQAYQVQTPDFGAYGYDPQSGGTSLIDINGLKGQFQADPNVMQGFNDQLSRIQTDSANAASRIQGHQDFGTKTVGEQLPAELSRIYGGIQSGQQAQGAATDAAMSQYGLHGNSTGQQAGATMAQNLGRGGFEAAVPLLQAGFGEQAANRSGQLAQLVSDLNGAVGRDQTSYQQSLSDGLRAAQLQAQQYNTQTQNQAAQARAEASNRASEFNASAKNSAQEQRAQAADKQYSRDFALAQAGYAPGTSLAQIAGTQGADAADHWSVDQWMQNAPNAPDPRMGTALLREQPNFISEQPPQVQKAYQDMVKSLSKDPASAVSLRSKYPKYTRALSIALAQSGAGLPALGK